VLTATVAVTFGEYAGALLNSSSKASIGAIAAGIILTMTALRIWGTRTIARAQGPIVAVVVVVLAVLAVVTHLMASFLPALVALMGLGVVDAVQPDLGGFWHDLGGHVRFSSETVRRTSLQFFCRSAR